MKWIKLGRIFGGDSLPKTKTGYAAVPFIQFLGDDLIKVYFSERDIENRSTLNYIKLDLNNFKEIIEYGDESQIELGELGTFDDSGIMGCGILNDEDHLKLYYIGWNLGVTVPFRNSIGLLISKDDGKTWNKFSKGPILDRNYKEPHFVGSNCVLKENGIYKAWYLSCDKWEIVEGVIRHFYNIKYAESNNGIDWDRKGKVAIDFKNKDEYAISVPRVIKEEGMYKMWYSYRGDKYKIGYAESEDGVLWERKDEKHQFVGVDEDWDKDMQCYPYVFDWRGNRYMLYNGNDYGKTGFGIAVLDNHRKV